MYICTCCIIHLHHNSIVIDIMLDIAALVLICICVRAKKGLLALQKKPTNKLQRRRCSHTHTNISKASHFIHATCILGTRCYQSKDLERPTPSSC